MEIPAGQDNPFVLYNTSIERNPVNVNYKIIDITPKPPSCDCGKAAFTRHISHRPSLAWLSPFQDELFIQAGIYGVFTSSTITA